MSDTPGLHRVLGRAQFFKKGHIIPYRVAGMLKRKNQHLLKFGSDSYVLPAKTGYVVICLFREGESAIEISPAASNISFVGSPYHAGGTGTHWVGNYMVSPKEFESSVLGVIDGKNNGHEI